MEPIPNWFRGLIIVIATLILCACRAPLQQPLTQSVLKRPVAATRPVTERSLANTLTKLRTGAVVETAVPQAKGEVARPGDASSQYAPIIQRSGLVAVRETRKTNQPAAGGTRAAVYLHLDGSTVIQPAQALSVLKPGSPFLDDPVVPQAGSSTISEGLPLAPVVDPSFLSPPLPAPATSVVAPSTVSPAPTYGEYSVPHTGAYGQIVSEPSATPIMGEYEVAPLAPEFVEQGPSLPIPFDFLPQCEIPMEVAPQDWATLPCESMEVSFADLSRRYPDEYICDGGDALGEVKVLPDWSLKHLDPEDTIGHYDTLDNKVEVDASNRVCIYAPRFAAVRKISSPFENEKREQVLIEKRDDLAIVQQQDLASVSFEQSIAASRHVSLQPASSLQRDVPAITGLHRLPVRVMNHDLSVHEDFRVMKLGIHKQAEKAQLADYAVKAISWSHDKAVQVVVDEVVASTAVSHKSLQTIHTIGDNRPAKLRVIKTASVSDALPGEEVEFTLRFDNIGHQPMGNVTIIDNLTTRLEYLEKTELCSLKNEFVMDENQVESLTLRWEITDPINPGEGGLIRFKCRVR